VNLADVQNLADDRGIALDEVGITGLRYPVAVWDRDRSKQDTIAEVTMSVALPLHLKGTHLSRFLEVLDAHAGELTPATMPAVLDELRRRLDSPFAHMRLQFPYFLTRRAPISGATALMDYACTLTARRDDEATELVLSVRVPVTSVCPCSKAISDYGAHNQRGHITIQVTPAACQDEEIAPLWVDDLIEVAEASASSPVYPLLKRSDERYVTMAGYDHPVFVEDMAREAARRLHGDPRVADFTVEAVNDESIHNHAAYARLSWPPATGQMWSAE
jgi:GTP cyclohydrolase IB